MTATPLASPGPHYASRFEYEHDEYRLSRTTCGPWAIAAGPDRALWFTETRVCRGIGRIDLKGTITEFPIKDMDLRSALAIILGPDGALWFAARNKVGRITTSGHIRSYAIPAQSFEVTALTIGPDNAIWFAGFAADGKTRAIGRIDKGGRARFVMKIRGRPWGITTGTDGALWFTIDYPPSIGRLTMDGRYRQFSVNWSPLSLTATSDGRIWFTQRHDNAIGWLSGSGKTASFPIPAGDVYPTPISRGPGGVWYAGVSLLGRVNPSGHITAYWPKSPHSVPLGIAEGPDGSIWFTENNLGAIGRIRLNRP